MKAETDLQVLLKKLRPVLNEGQYVFCLVNQSSDTDLHNAVGMFREKEGLTLIVSRQYADAHKLEYSFISSWITLSVHSSLQAVGLTAAFSTALANAGISCNVIAAFHHDHIFVDEKNKDKAMEILVSLTV